jgi:hypothetical protein
MIIPNETDVINSTPLPHLCGHIKNIYMEILKFNSYNNTDSKS